MDKRTVDYRQKLADIFIKSLEEKQLEWKKGWLEKVDEPINATNGKKYKGINKFMLKLVGEEKGYGESRWCTFNQLKAKGWSLEKGAKGERIEYWLPYDFENSKALTWQEYETLKKNSHAELNVSFFAKYFTVFNGDNIKGLPALPRLEVNDIEADAIVTKLSDNMGVPILNDKRTKAFYSIEDDKIHLPKAKFFKSNYDYNGTVLHELAHATGAANRLNRNMENIFGSKDYAFEELIAEISSCFMCASLRFEQDQGHINSHKAYVQSWIKAIKAQPNVLVKSIREAEKAANYMEYKAELINEKDYKLAKSNTIVTNKPLINRSKNLENKINSSMKNIEDNYSDLEMGM